MHTLVMLVYRPVISVTRVDTCENVCPQLCGRIPPTRKPQFECFHSRQVIPKGKQVDAYTVNHNRYGKRRTGFDIHL